MASFDITKYRDMSPQEVRQCVRNEEITFPTAGMCRGYAQANLVVLPGDYAQDFKEFALRNPFSCPVIEIIEGTPFTKDMGAGGNIMTDIPEYFIYRHGKLVQRCHNASAYWQDDFVGFLIGCSFSFEEALIHAGIEMRHIATGRNVPMYKTHFATEKVGAFEGPMVCSMRPMTPENAQIAHDITAKLPNVHGAPVHMGDPAAIGITDISQPDYGDAVEIRQGEIPVFWPCGVTPQSVIEKAAPPLVIAHSPGHMFITDILNAELNDFLEAKKNHS